MWVAGVDGCRAGWVIFTVDLASLSTSVELIDRPSILNNRTDGLAILAIDIPIGLPDCSRACDKAARKVLGQPRGASVFAAPCRASLPAENHGAATATNLRKTGRGLSQQAWGIAAKIKHVDDVLTPLHQQWVFEVHPEVCFWALAGGRAMTHGKKTKAGADERIALLCCAFPDIEQHLANRPSNVAKDDVLDAAVAAWTGVRIYNGAARRVCEPERDAHGLEATIWY